MIDTDDVRVPGAVPAGLESNFDGYQPLTRWAHDCLASGADQHSVAAVFAGMRPGLISGHSPGWTAEGGCPYDRKE